MALFEGGASRVIDLFAGPGGWDVGARCLGIDPLGIEWDDAACATRKAAGLRTLHGDVAAFEPLDIVTERRGTQMELDGLIASPPCQSFSMAGKRGGEQDTQHVIACAHDLAAGNDTRAEHRAKCVDERSMLVVEPIRWVRDLRPRWVALEQVPPVLSLWSVFAQILAGWGYRTWAGVLSAERYGVPQTRKRAILLASLDFQPKPPPPTHQAYVPGEPQRHEVTMFGEVLPWVSMAEALGWTASDEPSPAPTVTSGGTAQGGVEVFASKAARERVKRGLRAGTNENDVTRAEDQPAPTLRLSERMNDVSWVMRANAQENAAVRDAEEPAPTITGGHDTGERVWLKTRGDREERKKAGAGNQPRPADAPAVTVDTGIRQAEWTTERPATTVAGDPRIAEPGVDRKQPGNNQFGPNAVRVSVQEAAILQSFPPDYPWQGSRSAQFQQIGNAVPPLLAQAVLRQLVDAQEVRDVA